MTAVLEAPERVDRCLVAADMHLDGSIEGRGRFRRLLDLAAAEDAPLFILGDLFHYWFGPRHLELSTYEAEIRDLRQARDRGQQIFVIPGNRDFLLDHSFADATGAWVGGDLLSLEIGSELVHLSHGDLFCTSDLAYQSLRRVLHSGAVRLLAHCLPRRWVHRWAGSLRDHSEQVVGQKSAEILQPDLLAVAELLQGGYQRVICGHFHRRIHWCGGSDAPGVFEVLEPFDRRGALFLHDGAGWREKRV